MSKRVADTYITDKNWNEEVEPEEAGIFKQADKTTLERRAIKRAARRIVTGNSPASGAGSTFKGFTGFAGFKKGSDTKNAFGGLSSNVSFSNGSMQSSELPKTSFTSMAKTSEGGSTKESTLTAIDVSQLKRPAMHSSNEDVSEKTAAKSESMYLHQLKSLNESVAKWIKQHVDKNPYCILTPIFKDYETYLSDLEKKYPTHSTDTASGDGDDSSQDASTHEAKDDASTPAPATTSSVFSTGFSSKIADAGGFKFTVTSTSASSSSSATLGSFTKSSDSDAMLTTSKASATSGGLFGSSSTTTTATSGMSKFSGFKFGATGSVFGQAASTSAGPSDTGEGSSTAEAGNEDDEEYVPPKLEVHEIKEDDAIYSKRCKLFFKKKDEWKEKGLGHLHLKPCGEKTQLLVRADTTLGNILLNIMLTSKMPLTRQGKNNVALVCIPNPPIDGIDEKEMVPMLIRVKTTEDADELFEKLKEHRS